MEKRPLYVDAFFYAYNTSMKKYKNKIIYQGSEKFDSKRELERYHELQLLERSGVISDLQRQVKFVLIDKSQYGRAIKYVADFVYQERGVQVVEDVKSYITQKNPVYRLKKRMLAERYGIVIREIF